MDELIGTLNRLQDVWASVARGATGSSNYESSSPSARAFGEASAGGGDVYLPVIDIPQIAVVGAQSAGKSSVLEAIVGRDFIPRGVGVVTRRPLILQLVHLKKSAGAKTSKETREWGEFGHSPNVVFDDFNEIREEIIKQTDIECPERGISSKPLRLRIYSPNVIDITLIDLPGITKVPVGGQPADIEEQVRLLIHCYIEKPNCIILAVTAGNTDIATSDSLKLAKTVDPFGARTVGVVTKCDLIDDPLHALDVLRGKVYPLRRGFVGVVCRPTNQGNVSLEASVVNEESYFANHQTYRLLGDKCGSAYLASRLNQMLLAHICECLPDLKDKIRTLIEEHTRTLSELGEPVGDNGALLLAFFSRFERNYKDAIDGRLFPSSPSGQEEEDDILSRPVHRNKGEEVAGCADEEGVGEPSELPGDDGEGSAFLNGMKGRGERYREKQRQRERERQRELRDTANQLTGGARINYIFQDWYSRALNEFDPLSGLTETEVRCAIRNATGTRHALFVPEPAFENLVKRQISKLESPSLRCMDQVYYELQKIVERSRLPELQRFPNLRINIMNVVRDVLVECLKPTKQHIQNIIRVELAYINSSHPDFANRRSLSGMDAGQTSSPPPERERDGAPLHPHHPQHPQHPHHPQQQVMQQMVQAAEITKALSTQSASTSHRGVLLPTLPPVIKPPEHPSKRDKCVTQLITDLIVTYFNVVRKNICDSVPKTIMYFMVNTSRDVLYPQLTEKLYKPELFPMLLKEADCIASRRTRCADVLESLKTSLTVLEELGDGEYHPQELGW